MLSWCDHSSEEVETAVSRTAGPDSEGSQSQLPTVASIATTEVTRSSAMPGAPSAATDPFSARCQCIQMQCESAVKPSETRNEAAPVRSLVSLDSGLTLSQKTCTICMKAVGTHAVGWCADMCFIVGAQANFCSTLLKPWKETSAYAVPTAARTQSLTEAGPNLRLRRRNHEHHKKLQPNSLMPCKSKMPRVMLRIRESMEHQRRILLLHDVLRRIRSLPPHPIPRLSATRTAS